MHELKITDQLLEREITINTLSQQRDDMRLFTSQDSSIRRTLLFIFLFLVCGHAKATTVPGSVGLKVAGFTSFALIFLTNPMKADRAFTEIGNGEGVDIFRAGAQWDGEQNMMELLGFDLGLYIQFDYAKWQSTSISSYDGGANSSMGLTPVFRFTRSLGNTTIYLDTSMGIALVANTHINDSQFGGHLQFFDSLGAGVFFGDRRQWGIGYKFNHMSNNGTAEENNGIDFNLVTISYQYK
ncbi:acyloxyacyl hydrolase [Kaarinaea lacus]